MISDKQYNGYNLVKWESTHYTIQNDNEEISLTRSELVIHTLFNYCGKQEKLVQ